MLKISTFIMFFEQRLITGKVIKEDDGNIKRIKVSKGTGEIKKTFMERNPKNQLKVNKEYFNKFC